ncbi:MAG: rod shape-determining protein MreD [Bacteroidota bacterium]
MISTIISNVVRFFVLVAVQVIILNNVELNGFINPFMYVLFIMLLPFETPGWMLLVFSLLMGLMVDLFSNTLGMHAGASVFIAYVRPWIIKIISPRDGYESESRPTIVNMGFRWFLIYSILMVFFHHFVLFFLEAFRFQEFFETLFRVILSSILTIVLILISQYLFTKNKLQK